MKSKSFTSRWLHGCVLGFAMVLSLLWSPSSAAQGRVETLSITNVVPASTTDSAPMAGIIDASRVSQFALGGLVKLQGAGTSAITYTVARGFDQANWQTAFTLAVTAAGTTGVPWGTNVTCGAFPYWKITSVQNANATALTNHLVYVGTKRNVD